MTRHAVIQGEHVVNVIIWDGAEPWQAPEGTEAVQCSNEVGPGWTYAGGEFIPPPVPDEE